MPSRHQTYVKKLHTDTDAGLFLADYAAISSDASIFALKGLLTKQKKSKLNTALQDEYGINKRHASGIIAFVEGELKSAEECKSNHVTTLEAKLKILKSDVDALQNKIDDHKKYLKAVVEFNSKVKAGQKKAKLSNKFKPQFESACSLRSGRTSGTLYQQAKHKLHVSARKLHKLELQVKHLKISEVKVKLGNKETISFVGSKDESNGNQVCQLILDSEKEEHFQIRVPAVLEKRYGKYVEIPVNLLGVGWAEIKQAWGQGKAITFRICQRSYSVWEAHITVDVYRPITSNSVMLGCLGVDLNVDSLSWCKVNSEGNPKRFGEFNFDLHSKSTGQTEAILSLVVTKLTSLALAFKCPIVVEELDFQAKKDSLKSGAKHKRYNRMLSGFAYQRFYELLSSRCFKLGIKLISVNPAYSSLIGMTKFMSVYGMNSGTAAGLVLARRAMNFSEGTPARTAYQGMEPRKHVWSHWSVISKRVKGSARHSFFQPKLTVSSSLRNGVLRDSTLECGNSVFYNEEVKKPSHQTFTNREVVRVSS